MSRPSVSFICDANASVGFGHLSRCLKLAALLRRSCAIGFSGRFSAQARARILQDGYPIEHGTRRASARERGVAVVDVMFDREDMDYYDRARLLRIRDRFPRVVLLSSAMSVPHDLPVDVVVGHVLPAAPVPKSFRLLAGLRYAPVSPEFARIRARTAAVRDDIARIFVGFGASKDVRGVTRVLEALEDRRFTGRVDLLLSPFHQRFRERLARRRTPFRLRIHSNVRSVAPLLRGADVAFGTYGNVTFEALCLGTPFVAVPVKAFQRAYAARLAARGLLACLALDTRLEAGDVVRVLDRLTRAERRRMSGLGRRSVDGLGVARISRIIHAEAQRAGRV